jgi:hypothetical protein
MAKPEAVFIYVGTYPSKAAAEADYEVVKDLHALGAVGSYDAAVVTKDDNGKVHENKEKVGEGKIKTQPGKFSLAGEGLNVGMDRGEPFTGGTIHKVIVNVSGDPWIDREKEVQAAFARD